MTGQRVLALGAHPDDVEIYCLGTLLRLQQLGWQIGWVVATDGQAGLPAGAAPGLRRDEALAAAALVGVVPTLLGLQDGRLLDGPAETTALRAAVSAFAPTLIIAPSPNDYHPDHRALSRLAQAVCPLGTALLLTDTMMGVNFLPDLTVDITPTYERKMACLRAHASQVSDIALAALGTWASFRGLQQANRGMKQGEAFRVDAACGRPAIVALLAELWRDAGPSPTTDLAQQLSS
jgi:LmbE family N-acetylglucosaminyl deacetylase